MADFPVPRQRLVLVGWIDAATQPGWRNEPWEPDLSRCVSAGWLIGEDDEAILLGASASDADAFGERTSIPRVNIAWVRPLTAGDVDDHH